MLVVAPSSTASPRSFLTRAGFGKTVSSPGLPSSVDVQAETLSWAIPNTHSSMNTNSPGTGRPRAPIDLQKLIVHMASNNPTWGEDRIANELLLKIGIQISPRTVRAVRTAQCSPGFRLGGG